MPKMPGGYEPSAAELKAQRDAAMKTRGVQSEMLTEMENAANRAKINDTESTVIKSKLEQKLNKKSSSAKQIGAPELSDEETYGTGIKIRNKTGS